jgi:hypothetical protein
MANALVSNPPLNDYEGLGEPFKHDKCRFHFVGCMGNANQASDQAFICQRFASRAVGTRNTRQF